MRRGETYTAGARAATGTERVCAGATASARRPAARSAQPVRLCEKLVRPLPRGVIVRDGDHHQLARGVLLDERVESRLHRRGGAEDGAARRRVEPVVGLRLEE